MQRSGLVVMGLVILFSLPGLALPKSKELMQLEGPYRNLEEYCHQPKPDADAICNTNRAWIETANISLGEPFLEAKFFESGNEVTQQCSLGLRTRSGWFVLADIIDCHISAGTVQINAGLKKLGVKKGILKMELFSQSFHDPTGLHRWMLDETVKVNISCQADSQDVPACRY